MKVSSAIKTAPISSFILLCIFVTAMAQTEKPSPATSQTPTQQLTAAPATPAANPADVSSIDAIIAAVYDVISGPAGKKRDWDRMRSLFIPGGLDSHWYPSNW